MNDVSRIIIGLAQKRFGEYKVRGDQLVPELCPFCHGGDAKDRGTFAISLETGAYNCKRGGCNAKGGIRNLLDYLGEEVNDEVVIPVKMGKKKKTYVKPDENELYPATEDIYTYFATRLISPETVDEFGISADKNGNIIFPFWKDKVLTYVKYRKPKKHTKEDGPKEWQMSNTEPILFNMDNVSFNKPLIITEGEIDAMAVYESGHHNVVSVPCGCDNIQWVDTLGDWLDKFHQFILFGDSDEPGLRMIRNLVEELGKDRCLVPPEYPEFIYNGVDGNRICKDANEILYCYGPKGLAQVIDQCEEAPVEGILNLADVNYIDPSKLPRIFTRIPSLDDMIGGLGEGSLTILSGKRGEGKSTVSNPIALNAIQQGEKVCLYSGELPSYKILESVMQVACENKYIGVTRDPRSGKLYPSVDLKIQKKIREWLNNKFYLYDNQIVTDTSEPDAVLEAFKVCARRYGCKLFIVDNLMSILRSPDEENKAQARFVAGLKAFAMKYRVAVICVAHPRKEQAGSHFSNDTVSGSSAITNLADTVMSIEKPNIRVKCCPFKQ